MWIDLSMKDRAAFIKTAVRNGLTNLDDIQNSYNEFAQGGPLSNTLEKPFSYQQVPEVRFANGGAKKTATPVPIDYDEIANRQAWAESKYDSKAKSYRGAMGVYQIMPNTLKAYQAETKDIGDIYNADYNRKVRDWQMSKLNKSKTIYNGNPTDSVRVAKQLAAYNWGQGKLGDFLQDQRDNQNIDIYQSLDWVNNLPTETKNYVNFILRNKDTGAHRTNELYQKSKKSKK